MEKDKLVVNGLRLLNNYDYEKDSTITDFLRVYRYYDFRRRFPSP